MAVPVEIESLVEEVIDFGSGDEKKWIMSFAGKDKKLILNITNGERIAAVLDKPDNKDWVGGKIVLCVEPTEYMGKPTVGIRVQLPTKATTEGDIPF